MIENGEVIRWNWDRFRFDKASPNHIKVAESVLKSIKNAVTKEDLIILQHTIRKKWKEREILDAHESSIKRRRTNL